MILSVTLPFFALIFLGFVAARRGWVPTAAVPAFNGFLLYFAVPAMLFRFTANTPFREITNAPYFAAWSLAGVLVVVSVTWMAERFFGASRQDAAFLGLTGAISNAGYLGVPLLVALLGERASAAVILAAVADLVVVGSVGLALAQAGAAASRGWRGHLEDGVARTLANPFIISMLAGAAFSGLEWKLVTPAAEIVKLLADAAGPCALFAIGVSLVRPDAKLRSPVLALPIAAKLLAHPAIVWATMQLFGIDAFTTTVAVLAAALPSAGWVFIFAVRHGADAGRVSAAILLSTTLAFATLSALLWGLGVGRAGA